MKYVALLRGINVGPTTKVAMADLREAFSPYDDVTTVLQSGNVVFTARSFGAAALADLEAAIASATGMAARVIVLPADEFLAISASNPLFDVADDHSKLVTTFLDRPPTDVVVPDGIEPEQVVVTDVAIYQWCPLGVSKSKLSPTWWRRLGPLATTRNQRTIDKIAALL